MDPEIDLRIESVGRRLDNLEAAVQALVEIQQQHGVDGPSPQEGVSAEWRCEACGGHRLGLVFPEAGKVYIVERGLNVLVEHGTVQRMCRQCGHVNRLEYTPDHDEVRG